MKQAAKPSLNDQEKLDWLRLIRTDRVGPATFYSLLEHFGSATAALDGLPDLLKQSGNRRSVTPCSQDAAEREWAEADQAGARLLCSGEADYPEMLAAIDDAPPVIGILGNGGLLSQPALGIVGARNASSNGRRFAKETARDVAEAGYVVVSGLARGIDTAAHEGALNAPGDTPGATIAVVAGGLDICYPSENKPLLDKIAAEGAIVAEQPLGTRPTGRHFPRRNRLISGLSRGVLVVEAAKRSGSLITARMALEQGRDVFAVPGSPLDPRCAGTNNLIRQGAALTESANDILTAFADQSIFRPISKKPSMHPNDSPPSGGPESVGSEIRQAVVQTLSPSPTEIDDLVRDCALPAPTVAAILLELELSGQLERLPGNRVALING